MKKSLILIFLILFSVSPIYSGSLASFCVNNASAEDESLCAGISIVIAVGAIFVIAGSSLATKKLVDYYAIRTVSPDQNIQILINSIQNAMQDPTEISKIVRMGSYSESKMISLMQAEVNTPYIPKGSAKILYEVVVGLHNALQEAGYDITNTKDSATLKGLTADQRIELIKKLVDPYQTQEVKVPLRELIISVVQSVPSLSNLTKKQELSLQSAVSDSLKSVSDTAIKVVTAQAVRDEIFESGQANFVKDGISRSDLLDFILGQPDIINDIDDIATKAYKIVMAVTTKSLQQMAKELQELFDTSLKEIDTRKVVQEVIKAHQAEVRAQLIQEMLAKLSALKPTILQTETEEVTLQDIVAAAQSKIDETIETTYRIANTDQYYFKAKDVLFNEDGQKLGENELDQLNKQLENNNVEELIVSSEAPAQPASVTQLPESSQPIILLI